MGAHFNGREGAVIIGADFQGLGIMRNLSSLAIPLITVDHDFCIGSFSRYSSRHYRCPPLTDGARFVAFLLRLARDEGLRNWTLFPTSDPAVRILATHREELLERFLVPTPPWEITRFAYDKKLTYHLARELDIPAPATFFPENEEALRGIPMGFPVILKPSIMANFFPRAKKKALRADNMAELIALYRGMVSLIDPSEVMVQELLPGGPKNLYSFCSLFSEGRVKARIMALRLRQHPMDFGSATTFALTCTIPGIEEYATRFLARMGYYGVSEVEFMYDEREGVFKLLEMNARTWGWHTLGAKAGVNFSKLLFLDLHQAGVAVDSFENGVKWIREITDVPIVLSEMWKRHLTVGEYARSLKGKKELAVYSPKDPLPFVAELFLFPYLWYKRAFVKNHEYGRLAGSSVSRRVRRRACLP